MDQIIAVIIDLGTKVGQARDALFVILGVLLVIGVTWAIANRVK